jgi:hypothetical protein
MFGKKRQEKIMTIPPEIAWIIPTALPFIVCLLMGVVTKRFNF